MHHDKIEWPLKKLSKRPKRPARSFVTDMEDLFHDEVPDDFIFKVFEVMLKVPQHRFYVLTKRAVRLGELGSQLPWKPWIWAGVTVESDKYIDRIDHLKKLPSTVNKFIMMEPLLMRSSHLCSNIGPENRIMLKKLFSKVKFGMNILSHSRSI